MAPILLGSVELQTPVFPSANPWVSEIAQLRELYTSPYTGAVTTRTATLEGYPQDASIHGHTFLPNGSSLNTYGLSPHPLAYYIDAVRTILSENPSSRKPFIISISSDSGPELAKMADLVLSALGDYASSSPSMPSRLALEINASCPNLSTPPPFYSPLSSLPTLLGPLLSALPEGVTLGLKLPPFVHVGQFGEMLAFLESLKGDQQRKVRYLACCNTLGGALGFEREVAGGGLEKDKFAGMAGEGLHAIALGNVRRFTSLLAASPHAHVQQIQVVGIGGAKDDSSVARFLSVGAVGVACATALGKEGVRIFEEMTMETTKARL